MKHITKLSLIATTFAVIGTGAALASDSQNENRLAAQRQAAEHVQKATTIAVYADRQSVGQRSTMQGDRPEVRFEWRTTAKGQGYGAYVPAK